MVIFAIIRLIVIIITLWLAQRYFMNYVYIKNEKTLFKATSIVVGCNLVAYIITSILTVFHLYNIHPFMAAVSSIAGLYLAETFLQDDFRLNGKYTFFVLCLLLII